MSQISKIRQSLGNGCSALVEGGNKIADKTDGAEKVAKLVDSIINMMQLTLTGAFLLPFGVLRGRLQAFVDIVAALGIFNRGKEWFSPDSSLKGADQGKRMWQARDLKCTRFKFFNQTITIKWKIWNRAFMTGANIIETARFLDRTEIIRLGRIGSFAIGRLPVLGLTKDICVLGFSICSIWENGLKLKDSKKEFAFAKSKHAMWIDIGNAFKPANQRISQDPTDVAKAIANKYAHRIHQVSANPAKIVKWNTYKDLLAQGNLVGYCNLKRASLDAKIGAQYNRSAQDAVRKQLEVITLKNAQNQDVRKIAEKTREYNQVVAIRNRHAQDLAALQSMDVQQLVKYKEMRSEVKESNVNFKRNKSWVTIASDAGKIGLVTLGMTGVALGISAAFPFAMAIGSLALVVNGIGLFKFFYDAKKDRELPGPMAAVAA